MITYEMSNVGYVHTVFYTIYCILPMLHGHCASIYVYVHIPSPYNVCKKVVIVNLLYYLLDITALSELEVQAFCDTRINIC
jgi:hypothetical protein